MTDGPLMTLRPGTACLGLLKAMALSLVLGVAPLGHAEEATEEAGPAELLNAPDARNPLQAAILQIDQEVITIQSLFEDIEGAPAWDRDAFQFRIDQRLRNLLERINRLAFEAAASEVEYDVRRQNRERLIEHVDWTLRNILIRLRQIDQRIAEVRQERGDFDETTAGAVAEAFIQEQVRMRFAYAHTLIDHLDARRRLALDPVIAARLPLPPEDIQALVERTVQRYAERLVGQIRLDAQTLGELRNRRIEAPLNAELERAQQAVRRKQSRSLSNLETVIENMNRLGMDATEQRALLLQQRGLIGVELLERQIFFTIMQDRFDGLQKRLVRSGPNFVFRGVIFLLVLGLTALTARIVRKGVRALTDKVEFNRLAATVLVSVSLLLVVITGLVLAVGTLGVSVTPMLAGFGVAGLVLGLAMQDSLSNLVSGAMILLYRPYDVEDHIQVAGASGIVKKMNLVATTINTFDNQVVVVPNKKIWGDTIINFTASRVRRVDIEASFSYAEDMEKVERVLREILNDHEMVLKTPDPNVHMGAMKDSCVTMMVKGWVKTENFWSATWSLTREIKRRFDAEGISIPFPQCDVYLHPAGAGSRAIRAEESKAPGRPEGAGP